MNDFIAHTLSFGQPNNCFIFPGHRSSAKWVSHNSATFVGCLNSYLVELGKTIKISDKVFIHWLHDGLNDFILSLDKSIKVGMFFWGGDVVDDPEEIYKRENLEPLSLKFFNKHFQKYPLYFRTTRNPLNFYKNYLRKKEFYEPVVKRLYNKYKVLARLDYFFHWNPLDYYWIKKRVKDFNPVFVNHCYEVGLTSDLPTGKHYRKTSNTMVFWLGNSSTISNNHLDALKVLSRFKSENIKIYCPLSYGEKNDSVYTRSVITQGHAIFNEKFVPFTSFIPRKEYYRLFEEADVVIMWHNRTQGAGNIAASLMMNKPVFMQRKSTLFQLLRKKGVKVFPNDLLKKLQYREVVNLGKEFVCKNDAEELVKNIFDNIAAKKLVATFLNGQSETVIDFSDHSKS